MESARRNHELALRAEIASLTRSQVRVCFDKSRGIYVAWIGSSKPKGARHRGEWSTPTGALRRLRNEIAPTVHPEVERPLPSGELQTETAPVEPASARWPIALAMALAVIAALWKLFVP